MHSLSIRAAIHISAVFAIYLSLAMLIPASVDLFYGHDDWKVFAFCGFFLGGLSLAVALATQGRPPPATARFGFLLVNMLWITMAVAGAIPMLAAPSIEMSLADAIFESVSGITTTGGTVINGLDHAPPGLFFSCPWPTMRRGGAPRGGG